MSLYSQQAGINAARNNIDDQYDSKIVFRFKPLQGVQDGTNLVFQIPQQRLVIQTYNGKSLFPQIYKNNAPMNFNADYTVPDPKNGIVNFISTTTPGDGDSVDVTFNYTWMDDVEWDHQLNRAANEIGYTQYYTGAPTIANCEPLPVNGTAPSDVPDGLFNAITQLAASFIASALATRFSTRYDTSAGDQSFSPSQMAKSFSEIAVKLQAKAYNTRDDFYKGQGRQYRPSIATPTGFVLPEWTPSR
jgi:hypothetical protein